MKWKITIIKNNVRIKLIIREGFLQDNPNILIEKWHGRAEK